MQTRRIPSITFLGFAMTAPYDEEQRLRHGENASPYKQQDLGALRPRPSV